MIGDRPVTVVTQRDRPDAAAVKATRPIRIALVGNPNVGKSTLFNQMTGLAQRVGNFPGVTVERRQGTARVNAVEVAVLDLPGTYSLVPDSLDEMVVADVLGGSGPDGPDVVCVVVDAGNLRRNLFLLSEVLDCGRPVVVALNMIDEAREAGIQVRAGAIGEAAGGIVCVETVARTGEGVRELLAAAVRAADQPAVHSRCWHLEESDEERYGSTIDQSPRRIAALEELRRTDAELRDREVEARYRWVFGLVDPRAEAAVRARRRSDRLDRFLLHPVLGPVVFCLVMGFVFQAIFAWAAPFMDAIGAGQEALQGLVRGPGLLSALLADGVIAGVGAVAVFLPQILILFLLLALLEDTGYMTRAAFIVDRPLKALGLSGRSFLPLLSSFACAIPGIMAARSIPDARERRLTILLAPLMPCSARLPVYTLLIAAFVPDRSVFGVLNLQGLVLFVVYVSGLVVAVVIASVLFRLRRKQRSLPMVLEMPPYRVPLWTNVLLRLRQRSGAFIKRAGTVIFVASVVLWALATFPRVEVPEGLDGQAAAQVRLEQSYAGRIGHAVAPILRPLGFDWKISLGVFSSLAAREVFVGTMGVIYSVGGDADEESETLREAMRKERWPDTGEPVYGLPTVLSLLVFYALALQCLSTVAIVQRETNSWAFALGQLGGFLVLAWVMGFFTYQGAAWLGW
jgi:ferrous iron transport protein B